MKPCSARRLFSRGNAASRAIGFGNFLFASLKSGRPKTAIRPGRAAAGHRPLGQRDLVPLVDSAFRGDRIPEEWIDRPQFDADLAAAERAPDDIDRFTQYKLGYIEDVLVSLAWARGREDVFDEADEEPPWADFAYPSEPVRNPWRHVGRNDPCPCGSGKKFKKCCLASGEPPA